MSGFSGLTNALQSLNAQQYGLSVTGQNISNADTPGYTRQRADMGATGPVAGVPSMYATPASGGTVNVSGTSRLNDPVVDARARSEHGRDGYLSAQSSTLNSVEGLVDEPSDNGLSEQLGKFWSAWATVANAPQDPAARNVVLTQAAGIAGTLNETSAALARVTDSVNTQVSDATSQINAATTALAQLNGNIAVATATGTQVNGLSDQRDTILMTLSNLAGAQATINANGSATVTIGGQTVVSSTTATAISIDPGNTVSVGGTPAATTGGTLGGLLDSLNTTLPNYAAQLDSVAATLASTVNSAQAGGYDLAGNPGGPLFSGTTAATISVAVTDPSALAASSTPGGNLGGGVALSISQLGTSTTGADASYRSMVGSLATDVQRATQQAAVQSSVTSSVDALAQSSAGVSIDEETTNLLTYQRAYQASSRVLTTVDETLDTLISHTGRVGL